MFDRDDMSVFSDERLSDAIASGLKKFYEDSVQGMQDGATAGDCEFGFPWLGTSGWQGAK